MITKQWRLDVLAHGDGLIATAVHHTGNINEAHFMVHGVMSRAMTDMLGPVSRRELDTDLCQALRAHAANQNA